MVTSRFTTATIPARRAWALVLLLLVATYTTASGGDVRPCEPELNAVFLVNGIYPGTALQIDLLHIHHTGEHTFPSDEQLLAGVEAAYAGNPLAPYLDHQIWSEAGHLRLYLSQPMDLGAVTLVDLRDGTVVFAAGVIWAGQGQTVLPDFSSHPWQWESGPPASLPQEQSLLANPFWDDGSLGSQPYLAQVALDHIRQTDVMRSYGSCAPYGVTTFLHTPSLGILDPEVAVQVLIVTGHAAPPWGPEPIDTEPTPWDLVKSYFRDQASGDR
jgi:hypothetical protein